MRWYKFTREIQKKFSRLQRVPEIQRGWYVEKLLPGEIVVIETDHVWSYFIPPWDAPPDPANSEQISVKELPGRLLPAFIKAVFEIDLNEEP
jgi:hypothetical protein